MTALVCQSSKQYKINKLTVKLASDIQEKAVLI